MRRSERHRHPTEVITLDLAGGWLAVRGFTAEHFNAEMHVSRSHPWPLERISAVPRPLDDQLQRSMNDLGRDLRHLGCTSRRTARPVVTAWPPSRPADGP